MKNKLKNISDRFWRVTDDFDYSILWSRKEKPFEFEKPDFEEAAINEAYQNDNKKWVHEEFIKKCNKPVIVEPDYSNCIADFNKVLYSSTFFEEMPPSFPRYLLSFFKKRKKLDRAILFDGRVGINYFYFFTEVINKMWLLDKIEGYKNITFIIGERTFNRKYFQYVYHNSELKNYNWIVQGRDEYIEIDELYLLRPMQYEGRYFESMKRLLDKGENKNINRRVFLNRSVKARRYVENFDEIKPVLEKYNFEITDTDGAELDYEVNLFGSVKYLIGLHGAGNTNIIFSDKQLRFLEINPANRISCQYYWIARSLGIAYYDVILGGELAGEKGKGEKGFYVDPRKLEKAICKMLSAE